MSKRKERGIPGMGNDRLVAAMLELRRSNAATRHADKRTRRARTRAAAKERALREES